ncbi:hypothetical protein B0H14DRAFT_2560492 [Mycena olivaceomarginata]|nr:hypothetical protein B0H14DRAFT_2560492 [Mycena olivaceomarginata]
MSEVQEIACRGGEVFDLYSTMKSRLVNQSHLRPSAEWGFVLLTLEQTPVKIQTQLDFHGLGETLPRAGILTLLQNISIAVDMTHRYAESPFIPAHRLIPLYLQPRCDLDPNRSRFDLAINHTDPSNCTEILLGTSLLPRRLQVFKCAPDLGFGSRRGFHRVLVAGCRALVNGSGSSSSQHVAWFLPSRHSIAWIRSEPLFLESRVLWWSERAASILTYRIFEIEFGSQ